MYAFVNCMRIFIAFLVITGSAAKHRRPFWIIGHMVNDIHQLKEFLKLGANAIEADVKFLAKGIPWQTYHGVPCDCFRICTKKSCIKSYLNYVRLLTTKKGKITEVAEFIVMLSIIISMYSHLIYNPRFSLLLLDLKTYQINAWDLKKAGKMFAHLLYFNLFDLKGKKSSLKVLLGVEKVSHKDFILGFLEETRDKKFNFENRIGWQISENEHYSDIHKMWEEIHEIKNIWYSDGITNCFILPRGKYRAIDLLRKRKKCVSEEDSFCPRKFYMWSVDYKISIRSFWRYIDGVITNEPAYVKGLIDNDYKAYLRYATPYDDAWSKY
ncbi:hypothetical protein B4U80_10576 [Leptotrombidium deliense]|uniref:Uncharacterized protein n=1 Tax=Leptotrombidium deliense TaxID=299467 RepID=A0A443S1C5_9ACAR|nr:hypothetical protein B4U80_10576 [Leptotrombidium deliense]